MALEPGLDGGQQQARNGQTHLAMVTGRYLAGMGHARMVQKRRCQGGWTAGAL